MLIFFLQLLNKPYLFHGGLDFNGNFFGHLPVRVQDIIYLNKTK